MSIYSPETERSLRPRGEGILGEFQGMVDRLYELGKTVKYNEFFGGDPVLKVIYDMHHLFVRAGLFTGGFSKESYQHPNGTHISTHNAYNCFLNDPLRSFAFMHAAILTVEAALRHNPQKPVLFLEAGSGPAAPMALALAARFKPECVQVATIDWFADATNRVERLFNSLQLQFSLKSTFTGDIGALTPEDIQPDVVGLEVANKLLLLERQADLASYLHGAFPQATIIPHQVQLSAISLQSPDRLWIYGKQLGVFFNFEPPFTLPEDRQVCGRFILPKGTEAISLQTTMVITPPGTTRRVAILPDVTRWINEEVRVPVDPNAHIVSITFPLGGEVRDIKVENQ